MIHAHAEGVPLKGRVTITARDADGRVVERREVDNLVTLAGRNLVRDLLIGTGGVDLSHVAVGTNSDATVEGDRDMGAEVARLEITQREAQSGAVFVRHYLPSTEANGVDLAEAGIFTASSGGIMFARTTHAAISKTSSVSITYEWTIQIGAS